MPFQITTKQSTNAQAYMKTYLKLIGLEFNCKKVEKAKQIYKQHIRELGIEVSGKHWEIEDDKCTV